MLATKINITIRRLPFFFHRGSGSASRSSGSPIPWDAVCVQYESEHERSYRRHDQHLQ